MRKFSIVSDVISLLISVVDIKYEYSFSQLDRKKLVGIKIKMKLLTFLFRYKTASATGLGGREIAGAVMLYEFTNALILRCLPRFTIQSNITITLARSPFCVSQIPC